jgi:transcriptional regulator PpsR
VKTFKAPRKALTGLDGETVSGLINAAADIALLLDKRGVIRDLSIGSTALSTTLQPDWIGRPFVDVVTTDSRPKVELLMADLDAAEPLPRQLNHPAPGGSDTVAVQYSIRPLNGDGRSLAIGRDLSALAGLQQKVIAAEQSIESDYSRLRLAETRYRLLLQTVSDAILVVDLQTRRIVELNPSAAALLGDAGRRLVGRAVTDAFDSRGSELLGDWLVGLRTAGRAEELRLRSAGGRECRLQGALFRQDNVSHALLKLLAPGAAVPAAASAAVGPWMEVTQRLPDALVVTTGEGRVVAANRAFLDLVQLATDEQVRNESLERWLGRPGVDLGVLVANLRQHGSVRFFATTLRGEYGSSTEVEISAVSVDLQGQSWLGFAIRNVERRRVTDGRPTRELPRSVEQLTELVGRVSLKELVRETTDVIERLCIEAALELTGDNRASAAEMLGLSRQSLYVKLRRYGLGDLQGGPEET